MAVVGEIYTVHCYKCGKPKQVPKAAMNFTGWEDHLCKKCSIKKFLGVK